MDKRVIGRNRRIGGRVFLCIYGTPCQSEDVTLRPHPPTGTPCCYVWAPILFLFPRLLLRSKRGKRKRYWDMGALLSAVIPHSRNQDSNTSRTTVLTLAPSTTSRREDRLSLGKTVPTLSTRCRQRRPDPKKYPSSTVSTCVDTKYPDAASQP